jgi:hypothetical protein
VRYDAQQAQTQAQHRHEAQKHELNGQAQARASNPTNGLSQASCRLTLSRGGALWVYSKSTYTTSSSTSSSSSLQAGLGLRVEQGRN